MAFDRLRELKGDNLQDDDRKEKDKSSKDKTKDADIIEQIKLYNPIKAGLETIQQNVTMIQTLKIRTKNKVSDGARKELLNELERLIAATNKHATMIKTGLDELKKENLLFAEKHSAKSQMRDNYYNSYKRRFQEVMQEYYSVTLSFQQDLRNRKAHEVHLVDPSLTSEEVNHIVDSGKAQEVIKRASMSENVKDSLFSIQERHADILKLEQQIVEVCNLFRDFQVLVDDQQESLDIIEIRIQNAKNHTEAGEKEIKKAENYQKKGFKFW